MQYSEGDYLIYQHPSRDIHVYEDTSDGVRMIYHASCNKRLTEAKLKCYLHDVLKYLNK